MSFAVSSAISWSLVRPERHSAAGLSMIVVSIISVGAGSVAVSKRPGACPATEATSGTERMTRSCHAMMRFTSLIEVLGRSTGMKSSEPSCSVGMNSEPKPVNGVTGDSGDGRRESTDMPAGRRRGRCRTQAARRRGRGRFCGSATPSRARDRRARAGHA